MQAAGQDQVARLAVQQLNGQQAEPKVQVAVVQAGWKVRGIGQAGLLQPDLVQAAQVPRKPVEAVPETVTEATRMESDRVDPGINRLLHKPASIC